MVVVIVGKEGAMPESGDFRVALPLALAFPEKRDMKFRPKGAVLKRLSLSLVTWWGVTWVFGKNWRRSLKGIQSCRV